MADQTGGSGLGLRLALATLSVLGAGGCVTDSTRLSRLMAGEADEETVEYSLTAESPKLREAVATFCATSKLVACSRLEELTSGVQLPAVRQAALESMARRCWLGDRSALVERFHAMADHEISALLMRCRSADGVYALVASQYGLPEGASTSLGQPLRIRDWHRADALERYQWLLAAAKLLPKPRGRVQAAATALRDAALRIRKGRAALRKAERALGEGELETAEDLLAEAEKADVFDADLREQLREARETVVAARRERVERILGQRQRIEQEWLLATVPSRFKRAVTYAPRVRAPPHPVLGTFASWADTRPGRRALKKLRRVWAAAMTYRESRALHDEEKARNDAAEVPPSVWRQPLFPEVNGAFVFVKILSRWDGEALFSASDGLFVLRLVGGHSFTAYPGQSVRMTMHNRGDTMLMTNGSVLPVFISGPSPGVPRRSRGVKPDRKEEKKLARQARSALRQLERLTKSVGDDVALESSMLAFELVGVQPLAVELRATEAWEMGRVLVMLGDALVFCIDKDARGCPDGFREYVAMDSAAPRFEGPFRTEALPISPSVLIAADEGAPQSSRPPWPIREERADEEIDQLAVTSRVQLACKLADPLFPEFDGQTLSNSWFAATVCGIGVPSEFSGIRALSIETSPSIQLRCADLSGEWGRWTDAAIGCACDDGISAIQITRPDDTAVRFELECSRDGSKFSACESPEAGAVRVVMLTQTMRLFEEISSSPGTSARPRLR